MHTPDFARQKAEELEGSMMSIAGKWRITEMDLWDQDAIDLLGPAFIEFGNGRSGQFRFIAVDGWSGTAGRTSSSPGMVMTSATRPVVVAGLSFKRTAP
jgi:hypothetical protein